MATTTVDDLKNEFGTNTKKFRATINMSGKEKHLRLFETAEEASEAYLAAKRIHHSHSTI